MSKKSVLILSGLGGGIFIILLLSLIYNFCGQYRGICKDAYKIIVYPFLPLPFIFLFSILTYKLREEVFRAWWNFARWFAPVVIVITFLINSQPGGGGMGISGAISGAFDAFIIGIFYVVFVVVSLAKIIKAYRKP